MAELFVGQTFGLQTACSSSPNALYCTGLGFLFQQFWIRSHSPSNKQLRLLHGCSDANATQELITTSICLLSPEAPSIVSRDGLLQRMIQSI